VAIDVAANPENAHGFRNIKFFLHIHPHPTSGLHAFARTDRFLLQTNSLLITSSTRLFQKGGDVNWGSETNGGSMNGSPAPMPGSLVFAVGITGEPIAEPALVGQIVKRIASAKNIGLLAEQLQATAHRHPIVEGPLQSDRRRARSVEDATLIWD